MNKMYKIQKVSLFIICLFFTEYANYCSENIEPKSNLPIKENLETFVTAKDEPNNKKQNKKSISSFVKNKEEEKEKNKEEEFSLNFENASLKNLLDYLENLFEISFLTDDVIGDEKKQKGISEVKINFKSNKKMSCSQVWNFVDLILENAGLARIKMNGAPDFFRITQIATANKSNLPLFVNTDLNELPDYQRIRYMYSVKNRQSTQIKDLLNKLQSKNAQIEVFQDPNVLIITDNAYNIKTLMQIAKELDSSGLPEILSVLKLKNADASDVAKLYESLKGKDDIFRPFGEARKGGSRLTENTKIIAEPRTNALIIFGPKESVTRLEDFIKKHIDKELEEKANKIHVYELQYTPAEQMANILNSVTQFGADSDAARFGGVRSGEKYLSKMYFEPEKQGNRLIVRGDIEDYKIIKKVIEQLDKQQPQVAIEVFILSINTDNTKQIASQIRNKDSSTVNFQASGFFENGVQVDTANNSGSLITNLINLATSAVQGSTVLSLGKQSVWALLAVLKSVTDTKIIANPFLVATNKYSATVSLGSQQRIVTGQIIGSGGTPNQNEFGPVSANLSVTVTPQINDYGIVNMDIDIAVDDFIGNPVDGNIETRRIHTNSNVADQEVLALGGLIRDRTIVTEVGTPILSRIPIIGLLFKNKRNQIIKDNLVVFMSPRIIRPSLENMSSYTKNKASRSRLMLKDVESRTNKRDPVYRWFFKEPLDFEGKVLDRFILPSEGGKIAPVGTGINKKVILEECKSVPLRKRKSLVECVENKKLGAC